MPGILDDHGRGDGSIVSDEIHRLGALTQVRHLLLDIQQYRIAFIDLRRQFQCQTDLLPFDSLERVDGRSSRAGIGK